MKKVLLKLFCLVILIGLIYPIYSRAETTFNVLFKEGLECDVNNTVEVPIYIHAIDIEGSGVIAFECTISYDTDAFEMVSMGDDYFEPNSTLEDNGARYTYNNDSKVLCLSLSQAYFDYVASSMSEYTEIGKIKLKAKDGTLTDDYYVGLEGITIGNDSIGSNYTKIHVNGADNTNEEVDNTIERESSVVIKRFGEEREPILDINVNQEGTVIVLIPDEVNGVPVGYLMVDGKKIEKQDGKFVILSEPNKEYEIYVYGENGQYLTKKLVTTYIDDIAKSNEEQKTEKKSLKTGDYITIAFTVIALSSVAIVYINKKKKAKVTRISKH